MKKVVGCAYDVEQEGFPEFFADGDVVAQDCFLCVKRCAAKFVETGFPYGLHLREHGCLFEQLQLRFQFFRCQCGGVPRMDAYGELCVRP